MTKEQIITWMKERIEKRSFKDAAGLAKEFLQEHNVTNVLDPQFSMVIDAGFELAEEIAGYSLLKYRE